MTGFAQKVRIPPNIEVLECYFLCKGVLTLRSACTIVREPRHNLAELWTTEEAQDCILSFLSGVSFESYQWRNGDVGF
jgi:hypothetical protein